MTKKIVWLVVSGLMALSLVMAACGPAVVEKEEVVEKEVVEKEVVEKEVVEKEVVEKEVVSPDEPKYGGTLTTFFDKDASSIDTATQAASMYYPISHMVYEQLIEDDWTRGPAGTGEYDWAGGYQKSFAGKGPYLAESWEIIPPHTWVFNLRQDVYWALDQNSEASRLVNGRQLTPEDVIFNFDRNVNTTSGYFLRQKDMSAAATMEKTGPWQVTLDVPVNTGSAGPWFMYGGAYYVTPPEEVINKYGDAQDWRNAVGTGPFMLTDYVRASQLTMIKNPNYWGKDPLEPGKGNQLPYIDRVRVLIIPDRSTQQAAFRSGKIDYLPFQVEEDAQSLMQTTKWELQKKTLIGLPFEIGMRVDLADSKWADVKVRQALKMAIDFETIKDLYYGGNAEINNSRAPAMYKAIHVPMEELPENVRALWDYNPEGAKQLLSEAGYPDGFKAKMVMPAASEFGDMAAIIKDMWSKVGVDLELQAKESATFESILYGREYEDTLLALSTSPFVSGSGSSYRGGTGGGKHNISYVNDPRGADPFIEDTHQEIQLYLLNDRAKADQLMHDKIIPYMAEQTFTIRLPNPFEYKLWQPWVKQFYGESSSGNRVNNWRFAWIDQDLKEELTGSR
ncbi:ABC transporter substrate-binding protein [Chloroflexota bacterium]